MPSKTPKQAKFMRAVAHGWTPSRMKSPPSRAVAQEFVNADRKYSGGFAENRYWVGGLAAMDKVNAGFKGSLDNPFREFEEGGDVYRRGGRIGRVMPLNGGEQYTPTTYTPQPIVTAPTSGGRIGGVAGQPTSYAPPTTTAAPTTTYSGPRLAGPRRGGRGGRRGGGRGGRGGGGGGGGGVGGTTPRTIIPTDPASYVGGAAAGASGAVSPHVERLRQHQAKIAATLGSARGGHVNYYEEGELARPGHAEGPNPHDKAKTPGMWATWERKYHIDPPPPPAVAEEVEEEGGVANWLRSLFTPDTETAIGSGESRGTVEEQMEGMEQAYGGRVGYQAGGLATAAPGRILPPAGGVPPWIEPVGSGPGFMEPEQGYQFGGMAARMGPAMNMARGIRGGGGQYRGVPPQRGGIQRGAPPGGGRGFLSRFRQQAQQQRGQAPGFRGLVGGGQPRGGLAAMMQQAQQQRAGAAQPGGGMASGQMLRPGAIGGDLQNPIYGPDRNPPGYNNEVGRAMGPIMNLPPPDPNATVYDRDWPPRGPMAPGGGPIQIGKPRPGPGMIPPGGGNIPPYKRLPSQRRMVPPSPPGGGGRVGTLGGPGYGPDPLGSAGPGGSLRGGPMVPPNLQGYLQKMRMQNRPPANVGGGANRVGMQDQQGAQARALQRGTGRPPMSRRMGFGRGAPR